MRTIWKMSSAEPAANYPAEASASAQGGLHPVQAAGAEPDFMVDDEDDGFEWNVAQQPESTADRSSADAATGGDPDLNPDIPHEPAGPDTAAPEESAPPTELALIDAAAGAETEQPEPDEPPTQAASAAPAEPPVLAERLVLVERTRPGGKPPSWRWPAAMAIVVAAVVALLFIVRERMDAPRPAAAPEFAAQEPFEPDAGFPAAPVDAPEAAAPLPQVRAAPAPAPIAAATTAVPPGAPSKQKAAEAPAPAPAPTAATAAPRTAPPKQKAAPAATPKKRQRPSRRAHAQQPAATPADAISCILPGGQEVQTSYPSCRARGGVIYR